MGTRSRSYPHGVPKVSTFTHRNKLTIKVVSKPLLGLTTLNQALIRTPTPNLMGVIRSESMISQAFPTPSLEAPRPPDVRSLGLGTPVCSPFHQRTLPLARNKVGVFHSLASSNRRTDGVRQPGIRPVPPALCERKERRLVRPVTPGGVPAQQSRPLRYSTPEGSPAWALNPDETPSVWRRSTNSQRE